MPEIEWGRIQSHATLACVWTAIAAVGGSMMAFGSGGWRVAGLILVIVFGVLAFASLIAAAYAWRAKKIAPARERGGYQDWPIEGGEAVSKLGKLAEGLADDWSRFNKRMDYHVERERATRGNPHANQRAGADAGRDLAKFAESMNQTVALMGPQADVMVESFVGLAEWAQPSTADDIEATRVFIARMGGMLDGFQFAMRSMERYRATALSKRDINRILNEAITRIVETIDRAIATFRKAESALQRAIDILRGKLGE